jgi:hypothetical protein
MIASILVVLGAVVLGLLFMSGGGTVTRNLDAVATVSVPKDWAEREPERHPSWVAFPFVKSEWRLWGSGNPYEVEAWVVIGAPNCSTEEIEAGMNRAFKAIQGHTQRFSEFGSYKYGESEKWISEGNYQINSLHDPQKVTFLRSVDRARKVAFVARVYTKKIPHEKLQKIQNELYASLKFTANRATYFAEVGQWPAVAARRQEAEIAYANKILLAKGAEPAGTVDDEVRQKNGWLVDRFSEELVIGRFLGERVMNEPAYKGSGELTWLWWRGTEWDSWQATSRPRPVAGRPSFPSALVPINWIKAVGADPDKSKSYFFTVIRIPLTGEQWQPESDPAAWKLAEWMDNAPRIEEEFRAGKLKVE